jgi:hypothetical protein
MLLERAETHDQGLLVYTDAQGAEDPQDTYHDYGYEAWN